jgi:hypothetical protein
MQLFLVRTLITYWIQPSGPLSKSKRNNHRMHGFYFASLLQALTAPGDAGWYAGNVPDRIHFGGACLAAAFLQSLT